jgi:outer membrane protein assembly factor BamB
LWVITIVFVVLLPSAAYGGDWRMFHHDAVHGGGTPETAIGSSTATSLRPLWQANTGAPAYTSPAVVKSPVTGQSLVYIANTAGTLSAYDATTGARVWFFDLAVKINSSPAVVNNVLYVGASDHNIYALNATTGAQICHLGVGNNVEASPVVGNPGDGNVVYVGDDGITGADDGGHMWAMNAASCAVKWSYDAWGQPPGSQPLVGSWSPPAFAKDATGRPLVVFGSSSPEGAVYALDARTGARVWRFQTLQWKADQDVGAAPTVSLPGVNGFAHGVVYVTGKDAVVYALDLTTGALVWSFPIKDDSPSAPTEDRSTAALVGDKLVLGYGGGVYELNAVTGKKIWNTAAVLTTPEIISSPAVSGAADDQVALVGDMGGTVRAFAVGNGQQRWSYQTGGVVTSSPAIANGVAYVASADGYLYAFALGGTISGRPNTTISSPADGAVAVNPVGDLQLSGSATDDVGVSKVLVAVENVNNGKWWDARTKTWSGVFTQSPATLGSAGAKSTTWRSSFAVPSIGGAYFMQAEAVDASKQGDPVVAHSSFAVTSLGKPPETVIGSPVPFQVFHLPSPRKSITVPFSGTAADSGGAHPGIQRVSVTVINTDHSEYYCGPTGCPQSNTTFWRTQPISFGAVLTSPGAVSTKWHATFPSYDHPHRYLILAQAFDKDGEMDVTKAVVSPVCVKDTGDDACP